MPILNQKLFVRLVLLAVALTGGSIVLHQVQAGRVPEALLWQADTAVEQGKSDKAIQYFRQYLEFRPDDHDAAIRLADLLLARAATPKDLQGAHFLYERVLREAPDRHDVARKLVTMCIQMRRFADALEHAHKLLAADTKDGVLHAQVARCLVAQGRPDDARTEYEKAVAHAPNHVPAYEQYAELLERHFNKPQDAGAVLERLTRTNSNRPDAHLAYARFLQRAGQANECLKVLNQVFLLDPENGEALVICAEVLQSVGELRRARETLRDAVATYPRYVNGYRALSWLELMTGNQADALATLEQGVTVAPNAPELLTPLADLSIERGDLNRAREILTKLDARQKTAVEGRRSFALRSGYLRARLLMRDRKWNDALAELESLRTDALGMPGLAPQLNLLVAASHERRADRDAQIESLRRALAADPNQFQARVALANALVNAGRIEDALKEYHSAARSPFAGLGVQLAWLSLRLAWARTSEAPAGDWQAIGAAVAKLREQHPEAIEPAVLASEVLAARGDIAAAERLLRVEVQARPGEPRRWSALVGLIGRTRGTLAAARAVSEGQLATGDSVELRLARARVWADDPQAGREQRLALLEELSPTAGDAERIRLLAGLADAYEFIRDDAGRTRLLTALATRDSNDVVLRKSLFALALRGNDPAAVGRWRVELVGAEGPVGKSVAVLEGLHTVHQARGVIPDRTLAEWQDLGRAVLAAAPDDADAHLLLATVAEARRDAAEAVRHIEAAAHLEPTEIRYQEARLGYYLRSGQDEAARRALVRLEADPRMSGQRFRAIVEGALLVGGPEAFPKCLAWLAPHLRREPRLAVWAAGLLERTGKVTEALGLYKAVTESHPSFADGWSARLVASARIGEPAVNETTALAVKALDRLSFFQVCAECGAAIRAKVANWSPPLTAAGDRRAYAEACIAACEARGRLEDASPVLTALAEDMGSPPNDAAWARQTLAALTAALGSPDRRQGAINALRNGADKPATIGDVRSRAAALSVALRTVTGDDRRVVVRELIELFAFVVKDESATSTEWYQLAQLHAAAGDRTAARTCLRELTRREPNNLFYVALVVDDLMSESRVEEARPLVARLEGGVHDGRVLAAAGRFHTLDNNPAAVIRLADQFARAADPGTTDGAVRQRQVADVLDQLARMAARKGLAGANVLLAATCERYRASLRVFPEAVAPMAALLADAGQVRAAFDELERHKSGLSPTGLANAGVAIVRTGRASAPQVQMVKSWIHSALEANPNSLPLKLHLGELLALQGDFLAAEPVYREVLQADPKNLFGLNNLAWILAGRDTTAPEALGLVDRAIALGGVNGELLDTRARILIAAGRHDQAVADLSEAVRSGGAPLQHFHLALALTRLGKSNEAIKAFRGARERGLVLPMVHPDDRPAFVVLEAQAR